MKNVLFRNLASLFLFGSLMMLLQTNNGLMAGLWAIGAGLLSVYKPMRFFF